MTFSVLQHRAQDSAGNLLTTGVDVRVRHETPGLPLATIYADVNGSSALSNPTTGGFFSDGKVRCYVVGGRYRVELLVSGQVVDTFYDVQAGTMAENDIDAVKAGILLTWDTGTSDADPGAGKIRANNASLASATQLYIDDLNRAGSNIEAFLLALDDSSSAVKGQLVLTDPATEAQATFNVTAVTDATGYVKVTVSYLAGATSFTNGNPINFQFARSGDAGSAPGDADYLVRTAHASLSAERVVTDTTTVTWDWATAGQAKANVVASSDTVAGGIETATVAEMETGTDTGRAVTPGRQHKHPGHPKVFCSFAVPTTISESFGMSGVGNPTTGVYEFTFATAFTNATYAAVFTPIHTAAAGIVVAVTARTTTKVTISCRNPATGALTQLDTGGSLAVWGDQ